MRCRCAGYKNRLEDFLYAIIKWYVKEEEYEQKARSGRYERWC